MKKKAIEKVPYLTGKKCSQHSIKFVAAVAVKVIDHEKHLFLEIYENKKKNLNVPLIRFVYTKKDWGNYRPKEQKWHECNIRDDGYTVIWNKHTRKDDMETYISEDDKQKIKRFVNERIWREDRWWEYLEILQRQIQNKRRNRQYELRSERLKARCAAVPELPEDFAKWYKKELFKDINHIYYKRKGRYATFWCSHCGEEYTYETQRKDTFEGQFEKVVEVPRRGNHGICEKCDVRGIYKPAGKMKDVYGITRACYIGQAYRETGAVSRYIEVTKILRIGEPEQFIVTEIARSFFMNTEKRVTDYQLYNGYTAKAEWHDHNIGGIGPQISEKPAAVYPGTYENLKNTDFQYCGIREYMENCDNVNLTDYFDAYRAFPQIEHLVKMGLYKIVRQIVTYNHFMMIADKDAVRPEQVLGIKKQHLKLLIKHNGDEQLLYVLQTEKKAGGTWRDEQCEKLALLNLDKEKLNRTLQYITVEKLLNRVQKYAGTDLDIVCSSQLEGLKHTAQTYLDYVEMRVIRGYDMSNTVYLYPRDLGKAHQKMVEEINKEQIDHRKAEVEGCFPEIARNYRKYRKRYFYEDGGMFIRPAKSAGEIVDEGRTLHHCVGGNNYLKKNNEGESLILMLRFKNQPNIPYITVEITNTRIVQWYGENDKKPDKEEMGKWLKKYEQALKKENIGIREAEQEMAWVAV